MIFRRIETQPLSAAAGVGQILQDGCELEFGTFIIHCIYR
jgi:hypothetical protein